MRCPRASLQRISIPATGCNSNPMTSLPRQPQEISSPHPPERLLGAHMPTAGGLYKSLRAGKEIGCTAVQLFTGSPRQWRHAPLSAEDVSQFRSTLESTGIPFVVAHDSYLINLAAPSTDILERSQEAFRAELDRAERLSIPWVVTHMGAHMDQGEEAAMARLISSLQRVLEETDAEHYRVGIALETTAGQGTGLGWRFEQIGYILSEVGVHPRLGVCLDTCHVFVAGYDLRTPETYGQTWELFDRQIGYDKLKVIHANDARKPLGSRVDRHDHIGMGEIGIEAFARLITDPRLKHIPVIVETPDSETMHAVNVSRLRHLATGGAGYMRISVQLYGHYSDFYGGDALTLTLPMGCQVCDLTAILAKKDSRLKDIGSYCRFAVDEEYVELTHPLEDGMVVAILPPMSGG